MKFVGLWMVIKWKIIWFIVLFKLYRSMKFFSGIFFRIFLYFRKKRCCTIDLLPISEIICLELQISLERASVCKCNEPKRRHLGAYYSTFSLFYPQAIIYYACSNKLLKNEKSMKFHGSSIITSKIPIKMIALFNMPLKFSLVNDIPRGFLG